MCGIAGVCNRFLSWKDDLTDMNRRMSHRGPDAQGIWSNKDHSVALGHVRLSILDLSEAGGQPMESRDGRYVIVLNGEIYNHITMRQKLLNDSKISAFRGHSDTEVLIEYVSAYGVEAALKASVGMFAIGLYDKKNRKLYLARDRMGEKPLYYGFVNQNFVFASDIGCIGKIGKEELKIDQDALSLYFKHGYIPAPYTIYKGIYKVEAGSIIEIEAPYCKYSQYKYWDIMQVAKSGQENLFKGSENEATDQLESLIKESIKNQMVADVPVGAFLSGGIDSSVVVSIMQELSSNRIKTFSIGFDENLYNEAKDAKNTAEYIGTEHTELYIGPKDIIQIIPELPYIYGEPFADSSQLPTFFVSKLAKEKVTVSLSGDGGDELFCGYNSYKYVFQIWNRIKKIPYPVRRGAVSFFNKLNINDSYYFNAIKKFSACKNPEEIYTGLSDIKSISERIMPERKVPAYKYSEFPYGYLIGQLEENIMLMDMLMYLPDDILVKVDRSAMAVSLESRIPLLDKNIVEFAWTLPHEYKADNKTSKKILRNVLYRYVPREMMERPKKGFSIPVAKWIRNGSLAEWAGDMLSEDRIAREGFFDGKAVGKLWNEFKRDGKDAARVWYLLMFEMWLESVKK